MNDEKERELTISERATLLQKDLSSAGLAAAIGYAVAQLPPLFALDIFNPIGLVFRMVGVIALIVVVWFVRSALESATGHDVLGAIAKGLFSMIGAMVRRREV